MQNRSFNLQSLPFLFIYLTICICSIQYIIDLYTRVSSWNSVVGNCAQLFFYRAELCAILGKITSNMILGWQVGWLFYAWLWQHLSMDSLHSAERCILGISSIYNNSSMVLYCIYGKLYLLDSIYGTLSMALHLWHCIYWILYMALYLWHSICDTVPSALNPWTCFHGTPEVEWRFKFPK